MVDKASERLILAGFLSDKGKKKLVDKENNALKGEDLKKKLNKLKEEGKFDEIEDYADHHLVEVSNNQMEKTEYPTPINSYHLIYESYKQPLESYYFWSVNHLNDLGFGKIYKITDTFAASEQSAMYGSSAQRLGLAQDKVVNFMVSIGRLVKELFQIVREVRIIKERLNYYDLIKPEKEKDKKVRDAAEVTLKSLFVEQVEGGAKNTNSVYGLARELNFTTLPDLFFTYHPQKISDVAKVVKDLEKTYNRKVLEVLQKKLLQYLNWRQYNEQELRTRNDHTLKYLNQHYQAIRMYLNWIKPYLRHISRLSHHEGFFNSAEMVSAFEGALMEVEVLGTQVVQKAGNFRACILMNFKYRTSPTMSFQGQDYKQGPIHMGKVEVIWRAYSWTQDQVDAFIKMKELEDLDMIENIDSSLADAIKGLGDELHKYLQEATKTQEKKEEGKKPKKEEYPSVFDPLKYTYKGIKDVFSPLAPSIKGIKGMITTTSSKEWAKAKKKGDQKGNAKGLAQALCWTHYKNFKKKHGFATW